MAKRKIEPIYDNTFRRSNRHNYKKTSVDNTGNRAIGSRWCWGVNLA
ncbi:hypothetical protein [Paucilactobacillus hokkaidonensis]|nr:hypothetical protein [Paucilactobacillus hokkaidonensis]